MNALLAAAPPLTRELSDDPRETADPFAAPDALEPPDPVRDGAGAGDDERVAAEPT